MYRKHWGLQRKPFQEHCPASFCYRNEVFEAALLKLQYVLENQLGLGVLVAEPGCGKTFLLRMLTEALPETLAPLLRLSFPQMTVRELLSFLACELAEDAPCEWSAGALDRVVLSLRRSLREHFRQNRNPVILLDDAHLIDESAVFDCLQLLLSLREPGECEFSLILSGEPQLLPRLLKHRSIAGRVALRTQLRSYTPEETAEYVEHRLRIASAARALFEPAALRCVFELTGGVPQQINHLCELALLVGYADRSQTINASQVRSVAMELPVLAERVAHAA